MTPPYRLRAARPTSAVAATDLLGPRLRSYRIDAARHVIWAAAPFVLLLAYGVWLAHQGLLAHWFNSTFSVLAVATLFVLSIALIAHTAAVGGAETIGVHANGLVDLRSGQAARWDEIHSLTAVWDEHAKRVARHVVATTGGVRMSLGAAIGGVDQLVDEVRARMLDHKLAFLRGRLAEGGCVRFGALAASAAGIAAEQRTLSWSDVGRIDVEAGEIVVRTRGGERWAAAPLKDVPNAFLLAEVADENARGERTAGR
jgi:hypothetical protein